MMCCLDFPRSTPVLSFWESPREILAILHVHFKLVRVESFSKHCHSSHGSCFLYSTIGRLTRARPPDLSSEAVLEGGVYGGGADG